MSQRNGLINQVNQGAQIDKYNKYSTAFSTACFATILTWSAIANFQCSFCHMQWFLTVGALAATFTDIACLFALIIKFYQISIIIKNLNNDTDHCLKKVSVFFAFLGLLIATVGSFFFAVHIDQQINALSGLHLSAIPLPYEWVAPLMFLCALFFLTIASLFDVGNKPSNELISSNSDIESNQNERLNYLNFCSFFIQMPAICCLLSQSAARNIPPSILIISLFVGALGALSLLLDSLGCREKLIASINPKQLCFSKLSNVGS